MRWTWLWVIVCSSAVSLAACAAGGSPGTASGGSGSGNNSFGNSGAGTTGAVATGGTTRSGTGSTGGANSTGAGATGGGSGGGTSGGSSAGGPCTVADDNPCQLGAGFGLCCADVCTDSLSDLGNCGSCYNACFYGQSCVQGVCVFANCDNAPNGAGCTGNQGSQNPSQQCVDGVCVVLSCANVDVVPTSCALADDGGFGSCCQGQCSALDDPSNCGGCGVECATGGACVEGTCSSTCADAGCPNGTACTEGIQAVGVCLAPTCADLPDQEPCSAAGGVGGECCLGACTNTYSDPLNCGQCYDACQSGQVCLYGTCQTAVTSCAASQVGSLCQEADGGAGSCCGTCRQLDFQTDPANCGSCGAICSQGASCVGGQCVLADGGYGECDLSGNSCPTGSVCELSSCVTETCDATDGMEPCSGPATVGGPARCCGAACVDTLVDSANCGLCGTVCSAGMFCENGQCVATPNCTAANSGTICPLASNENGVCCSGQCVDVGSDATNCGSCGVACPVGQVCTRGDYPPCGLADGGPAPTCYGGGATCPAGTFCSNDECLVPACPAGASGLHCAFGASTVGLCCNGVCTDTTQDPENCGACGTTCASGICFASLGSQAQCLPGSDAGDCATANEGFGCAPGTTCLAGSCVTSSGCNGPFGFCQAGDGNVGACCQEFISTVCVDLSSDPQNCGGCGTQCPQGQTCVEGLCSGSVSPCGAGRRNAYCDLDAGTELVCCPGGGCADLETDSVNCGYCGQGCQLGLSCLGGQCLATSCTSGTQGQPCVGGEGGGGECCGTTCLDVSSDPNNCGGCGVKCASVEVCQLDSCVVPQCMPSLQGAPCQVDGGEGYFYVGSCCGVACVDTQSDPENCGLCGNSCGDAGCSTGSCQ